MTRPFHLRYSPIFLQNESSLSAAGLLHTAALFTLYLSASVSSSVFAGPPGSAAETQNQNQFIGQADQVQGCRVEMSVQVQTSSQIKINRHKYIAAVHRQVGTNISIIYIIWLCAAALHLAGNEASDLITLLHCRGVEEGC